MSKASIVLLTYNGEKYLNQVLEMIGRQKLQPFEVLAIDSASTDSTPQILKNFQIPTQTISQNEFSHSATRNIAVAKCSGRYVVFLTQDAVPADSCWLERLLQPFEEFPSVAGTYSRQASRPGADLLEANDLRVLFPNQRFVKILSQDKNADHKQLWKLIKFSNVSSAYDRQLLLENPFAEELEMAEDQEWALRMLEKRFSLVYEPTSVVLHSHEHSLKEKYTRSLLMGKSFSKFLRPVFGRRTMLLEHGAWFVHILLDLRYIISCTAPFKTKCKWLLLSPVHRAVTHYAHRKGWNSASCGLTPRGPNRQQRLL